MIHLTADELITSYAIFGVTHITLWGATKVVKQLRKGISVEKKAIIAHHVQSRHPAKLGECMEFRCVPMQAQSIEHQYLPHPFLRP